MCSIWSNVWRRPASRPDCRPILRRASRAQRSRGQGELLHRNPDVSPRTLRENVTSPGGTTAAALAVLMGGEGLAPLLERAVAAAKRRAGELSG